MNNAAANDLATCQFADAVRDFTPNASAKFQALLPFKEGIAELRRKHASYEIIADILRNISVTVSHDTVARFCHEVLKIAPAQRRRHRQRLVRVSRDPRNRSHPPGATNLTARGPRVADPDNI